jgi:hypothetical protein
LPAATAASGIPIRGADTSAPAAAGHEQNVCKYFQSSTDDDGIVAQ